MSEYKFQCKKCKSIIQMTAYCIAQLASNNYLTFNCDCGGKTELTKKDLKE